MTILTIDNQTYQATPGSNLLQTCLSLGFDIPYFCWHPALGSVGACRQCAVKMFKDKNDTHGRIIMACMTPVTDNMRISLEDEEVKAFHATIIEWMMTNHPHDCPVCDEGGECHLQDMTVLSGHTYRRTHFPKRTFSNQNLGPFINHEMNRCITCYRCVRFYNDYAGGDDLQAMASKNHVYFGRHADGALESEFSGNLVEVCPTGVFTDKTLKAHYTRKWDLQSAPSVCVHCGLGCNTLPGERYGTVRRIHNRYHGEVNGYFLCDRGRFGYEFVNSEQRIRHALRCGGDEIITLNKGEALQHAAKLLQGKRVIGIASPRASLESNALLCRLVGAENFYAGVADAEWRCLLAIRRILCTGPARTPSLCEVEQADAILVLGEDVTQTAARLALALRQASRSASLDHADFLGIPRWQDRAVRGASQGIHTPLFIVTPAPTRLDDVAHAVLRAAPDDIARLGYAIAHALDAQAPAVEDLAAEQAQLAGHIAQQLAAAKKPLIVSGTGCNHAGLIEAAANIAWALCRQGKPAGLSYCVPECNSLGLAMLEPKPLAETERARVDTVVVLENDLYRRAPRERVNALLGCAAKVLVIDHVMTPTAEHADLLLPAATFAEASGTLVSSEGRAQRFFRVFAPEYGEMQSSWSWLGELMHNPHSLDQVLAWLAVGFPAFARVTEAAPGVAFRVLGQRIPRMPARYSGRTAMHAAQTMHEPKPVQDADSPLAFSMEGYGGAPPAALISHVWAPHWNSVQALNKFQQEVGGPLHGGDSGVRLLAAAESSTEPYFKSVPPPFAGRAGQWLVVPRQHLFGSEELSLLGTVRERVPALYLGVAEKDAAALGVVEGDAVELRLDGNDLRLPVALLPGLPSGLAALPQLPGVPFLDGPRWGEVRKAHD